jgi:hypothetical protein
VYRSCTPHFGNAEIGKLFLFQLELFNQWNHHTAQTVFRSGLESVKAALSIHQKMLHGNGWQVGKLPVVAQMIVLQKTYQVALHHCVNTSSQPAQYSSLQEALKCDPVILHAMCAADTIRQGSCKGRARVVMSITRACPYITDLHLHTGTKQQHQF